jgi:phosphoribosyl 1,2-cyclic phosphodiesterase
MGVGLPVSVTFHGVRGSTPCAGPDTKGFGGNTSCVAVTADGSPPLVCDLGTGLRYFGLGQPTDGSFRGAALISHLHWDHIQGLPFFVPVLRPGARLDIYGPRQADGRSLGEAFDSFMCEPYFPVRIDQLPGEINFIDLGDESVTIGGVEVMSRAIPHIGNTNGYRINHHGVKIAYLSDHQQPLDGGTGIAPGALELCEGVDLLIHDAQFTPDEFTMKATWGHCTIDYACWVAKEAGAKRLALFHHDPAHHDGWLAELVGCAKTWGERHGVEVIGASEGLTVTMTA